VLFLTASDVLISPLRAAGSPFVIIGSKHVDNEHRTTWEFTPVYKGTK